MRDTSFILSVALALGAAYITPASAQELPDPERCRDHSEWRQLDFWLGTWDVIDPEDGRRLGVNVVEPILNDCALMENWTSALGGTGKSLNFYDPQRRTWRQVWVDGFGAVLDYREGEFRDGAMHFNGITIGSSADTTFQKLTFRHIATDTVQQVFESSEDGGDTWTEDWVGLYIRRSSGSGGGLGPEDLVFVAMEEVYERFTRAYRLGEPDSVVVLYTDDPLYLPPGSPVLQGRDALRSQFSFLEEIRSTGRVAHISFESVERGASGDLAWDVGYYSLQVESPEGGRSPPGRGKFATVWHRDSAGNWRIHVDGFSPAPPRPGADLSMPDS